MLKNILEALLFASGDGLPWEELLANFAGEYTEKELKAALKQLENEYSGERGIYLIKYDQKWQFQSNPDYGDRIADVLQPIKEKELSKTLLEVLSVIAYKQPITRQEIEDIRSGVSSEYAVTMLQKFGLIDVIGRKESIGRPALFGTTDEFLKKFRLESLDDLPDYEELILQLRQNFDRYYQKSDVLFREHLTDEEVAAAEQQAEFSQSIGVAYFEKEDEKPKFLEGDDISVFEADDT